MTVNMAKNKKWQLLLDIVVLACVCFPLLACLLWAHPHHRGFFVDDMSIRLPYQQQTIKEATLGCIGFALNVATILILEYLQSRKEKSTNKTDLFCCDVPSWAWESYCGIRSFTFGAAYQQLASNLTKYVLGRLRPHFIDVCRPIYNVSIAANSLGYIQEYTCEEPNDPRLDDSRLSFFSAHSSFGMYAAVFFIVSAFFFFTCLLHPGGWRPYKMYVQMKGHWRGTELIRHVVQFFVMLGAWYVGLSRVVEHYHHWSDVTVGFINGAIFGILTVRFVAKPKWLKMKWEDPAGQETGLPRPVLAR